MLFKYEILIDDNIGSIFGVDCANAENDCEGKS